MKTKQLFRLPWSDARGAGSEICFKLLNLFAWSFVYKYNFIRRNIRIRIHYSFQNFVKARTPAADNKMIFHISEFP